MTTATSSTTTTLREIDIMDIDSHAGNPRAEVGDVRELAASIEEKGILEPLLVAPHSQDAGVFVVLCGHRRLAAAQIAGLGSVPCLVREDLTGPAEQLEVMLVENLHRSDLTPVEESVAYQTLLEFPGYDVKRVATAVGRSQATVRARLQLSKLSEQTREKIQARQITIQDAQALVEFAGDEELPRLEAAVGTPNWAWVLENAREHRESRNALAKRVKDLAKETGCRVVTYDDLDKLEQAEEKRAEQTETEQDDAWVYVTDYRLDPAEHAKCPGHALYIDEDEPDEDPAVAAVVCTQPGLHAADRAAQRFVDRHSGSPAGGSAGGKQDDEAERAARLAEQKRLDQIDIDLRTAARVRRKHLAGVLAKPPADLALALARARAKELVRSAMEQEFLAELLLPPGFNLTAVRERLADKVGSMSLAQLAVLTELIRCGRLDKLLETHHAWPAEGTDKWRVGQTEDWRKHLVDLFGYELSDIEAAQNTPPAPAIVDVNLPDPDDADDEG